jgi:precorrin isomerase
VDEIAKNVIDELRKRGIITKDVAFAATYVAADGRSATNRSMIRAVRNERIGLRTRAHNSTRKSLKISQVRNIFSGEIRQAGSSPVA